MDPQKKYNFLIVDDEFTIVKIISDIVSLHPSTGTVYTASDGERAGELIRNYPIDVLITDILMPRVTGIELIQQIRETNKELQIIAVSASSKIDLVREAVRSGAYDYILKPFSVDEIMFSVNRVMERMKLLEEKKEYVLKLENQVRDMDEMLKNSFYDSFLVILNTLEARNKSIFDHSQKVALFTEKVAKLMGEDRNSIVNAQIGGMFHDIGKIGLPDHILLSMEKLKSAEYNIIKTHTIIGKKIVLPIFKTKKEIIDFIHYHHERFDGAGYPEGLKGETIPKIARVGGVVNAYIAMTSDTNYKGKKNKDAAIEEIKKNLGKQFDPDIGRLFIEKVLL